MKVEFKYDVAFSFLAEDEQLARTLAESLSDRFSTFIYSKSQETLAGTDGEKSFNDVFLKEARIVVVLYRLNWGTTPWTRIEETAIRNRAYDEGYDFATFIPLDVPPAVPQWLPRTRLWVGLTRFGITGAASVIEARINEAGGEAQQETLGAKAARMERESQFRDYKRRLFNSESGVDLADQEFVRVKESFVRTVESTNAHTNHLRITTKIGGKRFLALGLDRYLDVTWHSRVRNRLTDGLLSASITDRHPRWPDVLSFEEPRVLTRIEYCFDLVSPTEPVWKNRSQRNQAFTSPQLAEELLNYYFDQGSDSA